MLTKYHFIPCSIFGLFCAMCVMSCQPESHDRSPQPTKGKYDEFIRNPLTATGPIDSSMVPILSFEETLLDFGEIQEGEQIKLEYKYTNTGKSPLIISSASSSCGCTVPTFDKSPLAPGESGSFEVRFNSEGREGPQNKTVIINANTLPGDNLIRLKGTVIPKEQSQ